MNDFFIAVLSAQAAKDTAVNIRDAARELDTVSANDPNHVT
jgi:hypothetical protein